MCCVCSTIEGRVALLSTEGARKAVSNPTIKPTFFGITTNFTNCGTPSNTTQ
jgi:hypothetical protein